MSRVNHACIKLFLEVAKYDLELSPFQLFLRSNSPPQAKIFKDQDFHSFRDEWFKFEKKNPYKLECQNDIVMRLNYLLDLTY